MPSDMQSKPFGSCRKPSQPHEARVGSKKLCAHILDASRLGRIKGRVF